MLHANDVAVLRAARAKPDLVLWDKFDDPERKAVQTLAQQLKRDENNVRDSLKFLKSIDAFEPSFDPKKPLKPGGIFSLVDSSRTERTRNRLRFRRSRKHPRLRSLTER